MTKTEFNTECIKHGTCKECPYREWITYEEWGCSIKKEDIED